MQMADSPYTFPDADGHFGPYGGVFVAETLIPAIEELRVAYEASRSSSTNSSTTSEGPARSTMPGACQISSAEPRSI